MPENPLSKLELDYWYKAFIVAGIAALLLSLSVDMKGVKNATVQLSSLGVALIGIGEWINHPIQTHVLPNGAQITGNPRNQYVGGLLLDIAGAIALLFGIIREFS